MRSIQRCSLRSAAFTELALVSALDTVLARGDAQGPNEIAFARQELPTLLRGARKAADLLP